MTTKDVNNCSRYDSCSTPLCPLDVDVDQRVRYSSEERCPFCIEYRTKKEKRKVTIMPNSYFEFIPKNNLKMLSKANQERYYNEKRRCFTI